MVSSDENFGEMTFVFILEPRHVRSHSTRHNEFSPIELSDEKLREMTIFY